MLYTTLLLLGLAVQSMRDDYTPEALQAQITALPGLPSNANFTQFGGYINVGGGGNNPDKFLFYWFVESTNDPVNDPVFYWTNGGPGCSGLGGFLTEQGPFRISEDGETITINDYAWTTAASGIFIEQPVGVGFSYSSKPVGRIGDYEAANDAYHFIQGWLDLFPNYKTNDFYITSESYGGHYMPTLGKTIVQGNNAGGSPQVNLKGIFVGNPFTDPDENQRGTYDTWYGKQMVSAVSWQQWYKDCDDGSSFNVPCEIAIGQMNVEIGTDVDPYALDYPECNPGTLERYWFLRHVVRDTLGRPIVNYYEKLSMLEDEMRRKRNTGELGSGEFPDPSYVACSQNYATVYLNRKDVQNAIHAKNTTLWTDCSYTLDYNYSDSNTPMEPVWQWLIANSDLHMTVVSGDDDSVCGTVGTQSWIYTLGYPIQHDSNWQSWQFNNQVAGYFIKFDTSANGTGSEFNFATVHSAGHMIPWTQPERSLQSFKNFLSDYF